MNLIYSQTWVNDHLRMTNTCLQWPLFWGPDFNFHNIKLLLNNNNLSTTATNFGSRGWSLYTSLTVDNFHLLTCKVWLYLKYFCIFHIVSPPSAIRQLVIQVFAPLLFKLGSISAIHEQKPILFQQQKCAPTLLEHSTRCCTQLLIMLNAHVLCARKLSCCIISHDFRRCFIKKPSHDFRSLQNL